jgi:hypothetical protein
MAQMGAYLLLWNLVLIGFGVGLGVVGLRTWQRRKLVALAPKMSMLEARYEMLKAATRRPCVVMLGDSLTAGVPWSEVAVCPAVANYGFNGDTSAGVLYRLNEIIRLRPHAVFLMVGANDILKSEPTTSTVANIRAIVEKLCSEGIAVILHPVLPFVDAEDRVADLNRALQNALLDTSAQIIHLPIDIADLRDGLHLAPSGFAKWHAAIRPTLESYCSGHHEPDTAMST